jgi:hypothetical protein
MHRPPREGSGGGLTVRRCRFRRRAVPAFATGGVSRDRAGEFENGWFLRLVPRLYPAAAGKGSAEPRPGLPEDWQSQVRWRVARVGPCRRRRASDIDYCASRSLSI